MVSEQPAMHRLILWDVDATILSTSGIGGQVMRTTLAQVFGPTVSQERTFYSGKTDRQIIHETFPDITPEELAPQLAAFAAAYVAAFEQRTDELRARTYALPGVVALIEHLHTALTNQVVQAPLTGNIAPIARRKLELLGLADYLNLAAGAYGDDHHERTELVPIAIERATRQTGHAFAGRAVVVIGDTPHDIRCGKLNGARTVAVATGPYSLDDLQAHEPDALLADLSDFATALQAILSEA